MGKYVIGIDYGSLSARALLVNTENGAAVAESEFVYPHGILKNEDFSNVTLKTTDAFQHPGDYLDALSFTVKDVLQKAGVDGHDVAGLGFDFTACTVLPARKDGTPLCFLKTYENEPQAYVKLWKHHSAQAEADAITDLAQSTGAKWLQNYGGKVSSEWLFPKLMETLKKAPQVFADCDVFLEAGDWLTWLLTGQEVRSSCMAGYKALWNADSGYPSNGFWEQLDPRLSCVIGTKVSDNVKPTGTKAGVLNALGSRLTGLPEGVAVAVPIIDAHAAVPAAGVTDSGEMVLIVGTSGCHLILSDQQTQAENLCGSVKDGILPGFTGMEAGQVSVGDTFDWFVKNAVPESYARQAEARGQNIFTYLTEKAESLRPGQSGLLALDWFNGCRTPYCDGDLTGMILGLNLHTKPEEIFRALLEATAFGTKRIMEIFENNGVEVKSIYAAGGIAKKNAFLMQMYADVLGREIRIVETAQAGAKGSAILAAAASGLFAGIADAAKVIADKWKVAYYPNGENTAAYEKLYRQYKTLSAYFAESPIMKELKNG